MNAALDEASDAILHMQNKECATEMCAPGRNYPAHLYLMCGDKVADISNRTLFKARDEICAKLRNATSKAMVTQIGNDGLKRLQTMENMYMEQAAEWKENVCKNNTKAIADARRIFDAAVKTASQAMKKAAVGVTDHQTVVAGRVDASIKALQDWSVSHVQHLEHGAKVSCDNCQDALNVDLVAIANQANGASSGVEQTVKGKMRSFP